MTRNQIEYLKHRETRRNNQEVERLTSLRDTRANAVALASLDETAKHNRAVESETIRHNTAQEGVNYLISAESQRHNLAAESIAATTAIEQERSNRERERENYRSHVASETEARRHNQAVEQYNANVLNETSQYHANSISLGYANTQLGYSNLSEATRHNTALEQESQRHNQASEVLEASKQLITSDYNSSRIALDTERQNLAEEQFVQQKKNDTVRNITTSVSTGAQVLTSITNAASKIALSMP